MARTLLTNTSHGPITLPMPYGALLPPGGGVVVPDDVLTVMGFIGAYVGPNLKVTTVPDVGPTSHAAGVVTPMSLTLRDVHGLGVGMLLDGEMTAGVGGVPDDVVIYNGNVPFVMEIEDITISVTTGQAGSNIVFRDALGGLGNALSDVINTGPAGKTLSAGIPIPLPLGSSIVIRRSNNLVVGEYIMHIVRIA